MYGGLKLLKIPDLGAALLWALCGGFVMGVLVQTIAPKDTYALIAAVAACVCIVLGTFDTSRLKIAIVVATALIAFGTGVFREKSAELVADPLLVAQVGQKIEVDAIVSDEPDNRATQVRVPVRIVNFTDATGSSRDTAASTILVVFPSHTELYYGERVHISGTLNTPKSFDAGVGRQFNYPKYLEVQGIQFQLDRATLLKGEGFEGNTFIALSYFIKERFVSGLQLSLPEPHSGLAGGITVGDKRAMGKDITQEFRTVSLVHIVVLSGYNITIIISALFRILARAPRFVRFGTGGFVAIFFAVMTGFASSSLRAALMALISITGTLSGRLYKPERALALVAAVMVAWNPYLLVFDPGFQLSFLATAGLIAFSPFFTQVASRIPETAGLREITISSLSAQVAVLPLILYQSGSLSLVALPANLLALTAVPPAMLASSVAAVAGIIAIPIAPLLGLPAFVLLSYILGVAHWLASIPYAAVIVPAFSALWLVPVYGALFFFAVRTGTTTEMTKEKTAHSARFFPTLTSKLHCWLRRS